MKKLSLSEWASVGEVIASVAVVISLLFVAYTIGRNTDAVQGSNENLLFETHAALANQLIADPTLAAILIKVRDGGEPLTDVEQVRWETYQLNLLDIWALAYMRYQADLLADRHWRAWDDYFAHRFSKQAERLTPQRWEELRYGFDQDFWTHVKAATGVKFD